MIELKSAREIEYIRESAQIAAKALQFLEPYVVPGVTTNKLDKLADGFMRDHGATPSSLGYHGFPKSICTSINEVIVHGIPGPRKLRKGDIITIDITAYKNGFHGDTARTYLVGKVAPHARKLVEVTAKSLELGIEQARIGNRLGDIGYAINSYITQFGYSAVRDFTGHGIGRRFHEPPQILHYGKKGTGLPIRKGMVFTIEPMINMGTWKFRILKDGWTAVTQDGKLAAQFEHTIAITENGPDVLSRLNSSTH